MRLRMQRGDYDSFNKSYTIDKKYCSNIPIWSNISSPLSLKIYPYKVSANWNIQKSQNMKTDKVNENWNPFQLYKYIGE